MIMLVAAPTPCSRTGFHMIKISLWFAVVSAQVADAAVAVAQEVPVGAPGAGVNAGSTMIRSPGADLSRAAWMEAEGATWVGCLPPTVTVTVSTERLPFPEIISNSPQ